MQAVRVRQYARAAGILAKTDKIDAKVLAAFGSAMQPEPTSSLSAEQKRLRQYETQRRHLSRIWSQKKIVLRSLAAPSCGL